MEKDKRYLVFCYNDFYPRGGLEDMKKSFDTITEAVEFISKIDYNYQEIYDRVGGVRIDLSM